MEDIATTAATPKVKNVFGRIGAGGARKNGAANKKKKGDHVLI